MGNRQADTLVNPLSSFGPEATLKPRQGGPSRALTSDSLAASIQSLGIVADMDPLARNTAAKPFFEADVSAIIFVALGRSLARHSASLLSAADGVLVP